MSYIAEILKKDRSKKKVLHLLDYIGTQPDRVDEMMKLVLGPDQKKAIHAAWVLYHYVEIHVRLLHPYFDDAVAVLLNHPHQAIERGLLRMFWMMDSWPEEHFTPLVDHMMQIILNTKSKIAAQALSMEALLKHLDPYPEMLKELAYVVEEGVPYGSAGYKAKARKVIKRINKKK